MQSFPTLSSLAALVVDALFLFVSFSSAPLCYASFVARLLSLRECYTFSVYLRLCAYLNGAVYVALTQNIFSCRRNCILLLFVVNPVAVVWPLIPTWLPHWLRLECLLSMRIITGTIAAIQHHQHQPHSTSMRMRWQRRLAWVERQCVYAAGRRLNVTTQSTIYSYHNYVYVTLFYLAM